MPLVRKYFDSRKKNAKNTPWDNNHKLIFGYLSSITAEVRKKIKLVLSSGWLQFLETTTTKT